MNNDFTVIEQETEFISPEGFSPDETGFEELITEYLELTKVRNEEVKRLEDIVDEVKGREAIEFDLNLQIKELEEKIDSLNEEIGYKSHEIYGKISDTAIQHQIPVITKQYQLLIIENDLKIELRK